MNKKVLVLGAGMVGRAIAIDLSKQYEVTSVDLSMDNLNLLKKYPAIKTLQGNLAESKTINNIIVDFDLVIGAVPGFMGFQTMQTVISNGKNMVDISFFPEDPFLHDELAKKHNVTIATDCGVAPGMDNLILGYHDTKMEVEYFECLVGGLPKVRTMPFQYKAPFSPIDVIEEYIRPSRIVENGAVVIKPALSEPELMEFEGIGTLEAFNTDGLRTLISTMKIPTMKERTLRYPGHIDIMKVLRDTGFFSDIPIKIKDKEIAPIELTSKLLFPKWKLGEEEEEFTVMRVVVKGKENGKPKQYQYDLLDRYDAATKTSSMARTTGYTCTAVAKLVLEGKFSRKGICPPEYIGMEKDCLNDILAYQKERGIEYRVKES